MRAPLILQTILGFDAATIASAFLVAPATMGQRLVRAKTKIRRPAFPSASPSATSWRAARRRARGDLRRLRRGLVRSRRHRGASARPGRGGRSGSAGSSSALLPDEPEALGLLALMLHAEARRAARRGADGGYVPLGEQDPALWDAALIEEAEALLRQASRMGAIGRYQLEAAMQSAHVVRRVTGRADWPAIVRSTTPWWRHRLAGGRRSTARSRWRRRGRRRPGSPRSTLVRRCAPLPSYQPYWAARADLLARAGALAEADRAYTRPSASRPTRRPPVPAVRLDAL